MIRLSPRCFLVALAMSVGLPAFAQKPLSALPKGSGKELVEAACVACHQTDIIFSSTGYTHDRWRHLVGTMIDLPEPPGLGRDTVSRRDFSGAIRSPTDSDSGRQQGHVP